MKLALGTGDGGTSSINKMWPNQPLQIHDNCGHCVSARGSPPPRHFDGGERGELSGLKNCQCDPRATSRLKERPINCELVGLSTMQPGSEQKTLNTNIAQYTLVAQYVDAKQAIGIFVLESLHARSLGLVHGSPTNGLSRQTENSKIHVVNLDLVGLVNILLTPPPPISMFYTLCSSRQHQFIRPPFLNSSTSLGLRSRTGQELHIYIATYITIVNKRQGGRYTSRKVSTFFGEPH